MKNPISFADSIKMEGLFIDCQRSILMGILNVQKSNDNQIFWNDQYEKYRDIFLRVDWNAYLATWSLNADFYNEAKYSLCILRSIVKRYEDNSYESQYDAFIDCCEEELERSFSERFMECCFNDIIPLAFKHAEDKDLQFLCDVICVCNCAIKAKENDEFNCIDFIFAFNELNENQECIPYGYRGRLMSIADIVHCKVTSLKFRQRMCDGYDYRDVYEIAVQMLIEYSNK